MTRALTFSTIALLLAAGPVRAQQNVDVTRTVVANATIHIENTAGSVRVQGWDRNEVRVTGTLAEDAEELQVRGGQNRLRIEVEFPEGERRSRRGGESRLEFRVPAGARVEIETISADISVAGVTGEVDLESVSGQMIVEGNPRRVDVEGVSSNIRVTGRPGTVNAESVSGEIDVREAGSEISAATVSGRIIAAASRLRRGDFESVSGSISFTGALERDARLDIENYNGVVELRLPASTSATFEVSTFSGEIENQLTTHQPRRTSRYAPGRELSFVAGDGGARVSIESFSGSVRILKQ